MVGLAIVAVWLLVVAAMLVRQWWVSELAQAHAEVDASGPATLPTAPTAIAPGPVGEAAACVPVRFGVTAAVAR